MNVSRPKTASAMTSQEIEQRVRSLGEWFHNLDLRGVRTALTGQTVLDIEFRQLRAAGFDILSSPAPEFYLCHRREMDPSRPRTVYPRT